MTSVFCLSAARGQRYLLRAVCVCLFLILTACSPNTFDLIPRNGFIQHFEESDKERFPFDSYWDISDNEEWNKRVAGLAGKSQPIHILPVTLKYFSNMPTNPGDREGIENLCEYFNKALFERMKKLDAEQNTFHLVDKPGKDVYTLQIAILGAKPTKIATNIIKAATTNTLGFLVTGGGIVSGQLLNSEEDKGYIAMGAKFFDPKGKLVAEVADLDFGQKSLAGRFLLEVRDFRRYAYQRQAIDDWVEIFVKCFTTIHEEKIKRHGMRLI